jgi:poly-gamma-glutamate synthesis protein (capsule biosynthesis protein)
MLAGSDRRPAQRPDPDRFEIVWVGDTMIGDKAQSKLREHGYQWPFRFLRPLLRADYLVGNAEGPITSRTEKIHLDRRWSYNSQPAVAAALAEVGFDAMSLSNNHAFDRGPDGLSDTIKHLTEAGVRTFGAGSNADAASAPLLIPTPFGSIAVTGIGKEWKHGQVADTHNAGTIVMSEESIREQKRLADEAGARWVVAFVHWGSTYTPVRNIQRQEASLFAAAGYDLVVGAGSHVAQQAEIIDGMPVLHSLGNFVFGSRGRFTTEMPGYGLIARTMFTPAGLTGIELSTITTNNKRIAFQPRPSTRADSRRLLRDLGPDVTFPKPLSLDGLLRRRVVGKVELSGSR